MPQRRPCSKQKPGKADAPGAWRLSCQALRAPVHDHEETIMRNVYLITDTSTAKAIAYTLVQGGMVKREANNLARQLRSNGSKVAVFKGNEAESHF